MVICARCGSCGYVGYIVRWFAHGIICDWCYDKWKPPPTETKWEAITRRNDEWLNRSYNSNQSDDSSNRSDDSSNQSDDSSKPSDDEPKGPEYVME